MKNNFFVYSSPKLSDIWGNYDIFLKEYQEAGIPSIVDLEKVTTLYYMLYARYGNSTIAFTDVNQFKYNVYTLIYTYGPTWAERLDLQKKLRELSDEELIQGGKAIYNTALNPSNSGSTQQIEELEYINSQNTTNYKKSKMEAIAMKWQLLDNDVTTEFLNKFKPLFRKILDPMQGVIYTTNTNTEEEIL